MSDSEPKKSSSSVESNRALRALARLLGRQAARQLLAEKVIQEPASAVHQDRNVISTSNSSTKLK